MKKVFILFISFLFFFNNHSFAQEEEKKFGIQFSGFVKSDFFFDTRQTVAAREGHFLLWPSPAVNDLNGNDINAKPSFNFLAIQSRLSGRVSGPDAFGAKTSGLIEGDFFAQSNENINLFRLRHAFVKFNWPNTEILAGQYWNPFFVTGCFPGTVSFNTGTPLQSFARNPQLRLTQSIGNLNLILAALSQRDFTNFGPDPVVDGLAKNTGDFLRNSGTPDMHLQFQYKVTEESGTSMLFGAGGEYKTIVPRLSSSVENRRYKVDEKLGSFAAIAFTKLSFRTLTLKLQGRYGENISDLLSVSGFAVKGITDPVTGERSYTPLQNATFWGEIHSNGDKLQIGVFGGYLKNLGTKEEMSDITNPVYGLGHNIESLYRISPRIMFLSNKTKIGCELEYTSAAYGSDYDVNYVPGSTTQVGNARILLSAIYSF